MHYYIPQNSLILLNLQTEAPAIINVLKKGVFNVILNVFNTI